MGYSFKGVCYQSLPQARSEYCSQSFPLLFAAGETSYQLSCAPAIDYNAATASLVRAQIGGTSTAYSAPWPAMPECDTTGGFSIANDYLPAAMLLFVTVWGSKKLIGIFDTNDKGE